MDKTFAGFIGSAVTLAGLGVLMLQSPDSIVAYVMWGIIPLLFTVLPRYVYPNPKVKLRKTIRDVLMDVTNEGTKGDFEAQVEVIYSTDYKFHLLHPQYAGYWINETSKVISILHNATHTLKLAQFIISENARSACLRLYRMEEYGKECFDTNSYPIGQTNFVVPEVCLRTLITSHPCYWHGTREVIIRIDAHGEAEVIKVKKRNKPKFLKLLKEKDSNISPEEFHRILDKASKPVKKSDKEKS
jgi:hypothetical protein